MRKHLDRSSLCQFFRVTYGSEITLKILSRDLGHLVH